MDKQRARSIMQSAGIIGVMHNGSPVWLENLKGDMAEVSYINTDRRAEVPLNELVEGGTM